MHADGVGVDDERALALPQGDDAEALLQPTEQQPHHDAHHGSEGADEPPLEEEDARYLAVAGTHSAQRLHVVALVDDEHRETADDVEARHDEDEREEDVGDELLDLHDAEGVVLLLIAVANVVFGSAYLAYAALHGLEVAARLQPQLQAREHALLVEDAAGEANAGEDVAAVVLGLQHAEHHAGRIERVDDEALLGGAHVELTFAAGGIDM